MKIKTNFNGQPESRGNMQWKLTYDICLMQNNGKT